MTAKVECTCDLNPRGHASYTDSENGRVITLEIFLVKCPLCKAAPELLAACKSVVDAAVTVSDVCAICLCDLNAHASGCVITSVEAAIAKVEKRS